MVNAEKNLQNLHMLFGSETKHSVWLSFLLYPMQYSTKGVMVTANIEAAVIFLG